MHPRKTDVGRDGPARRWIAAQNRLERRAGVVASYRAQKSGTLPSSGIGTGARNAVRDLQREGDPVGVHALPPVQVAPGQAVDQEFSGGHVGSHGDGVLVAQAGDVQHILVHLVILG